MSILKGPADADHFRVKVGRYGDRFYTDPLPACGIAPASDWHGPSWSIVKGAAGKDWSFVANKRNAMADRTELERIAALDPEQRSAAFNAINKNGLTQAAGRGTIIHLWAEDLLAGRSPREITDIDLMAMKLPKAALTEALMYRAALAAFFDTYQPEVVAAEYVALHRNLNGHGYGCTPDVAARIDGQILGIDWKSRGIDSDHGAYPEEAAQIAAGARAEYMIVADEHGNPQRALMPDITGGIVVSIKPDGCRVYPVDLDKAFAHVEAMHAFWVARLDEKKSIGRAWAPKGTKAAAEATPDNDALVANLRERVGALLAAGHENDIRVAWPEGVPTLAASGHTPAQLVTLEQAIAQVEARHEMPFNPAPIAAPEPSIMEEPVAVVEQIDEGGPADQQAIDTLKRRINALAETAMDNLKVVTGEAHAAGRTLNLTLRPTVRTWEIARAIVLWAERGADILALEQAVADAATPAQCAEPTTGAALSLFTIAQARSLADALTGATSAAHAA